MRFCAAAASSQAEITLQDSSSPPAFGGTAAADSAPNREVTMHRPPHFPGSAHLRKARVVIDVAGGQQGLPFQAELRRVLRVGIVVADAASLGLVMNQARMRTEQHAIAAL